MPYEFGFDQANRTLRARFMGEVGDEELLEFYDEATEVAAAADPLGSLVDFSDCARFEVTIDTVRRLAKAAPALPNPSRPRVIVAPTDRIYGMGRLFEIEGETTRPNIHVVRTLNEALAILGVFGETNYQPLQHQRTRASEANPY
jgi:hypothetical protein